jgi:hypothetical protein
VSEFISQPSVALGDDSAIEVQSYVAHGNSSVDFSFGIGPWPNKLRTTIALSPAKAAEFIRTAQAALDVIFSHHPELRPATEPVIPSDAPTDYDDPMFADAAG